MYMRLLSAILLNFISSAAFAGSFIEIQGETYCGGSNGFAYQYEYEWREGGWGPHSLLVLGLKVYDFRTKNVRHYDFVKEPIALKKYGLVFKATDESPRRDKYVFIDYDQFSGFAGFTEAFDISKNPINPWYDTSVLYKLAATYQPWVECY